MKMQKPTANSFTTRIQSWSVHTKKQCGEEKIISMAPSEFPSVKVKSIMYQPRFKLGFFNLAD